VKPAHLGFVALALLAGSAGYVAREYAVRSAAPPAPPITAPSPPAPGAAARPEAVHAWSFADVDGAPQSLGQWRGRLLVLNFWATWCPPCLREIPAFIDLQQRYGAQGLQFVGIALDQPEAVRPFVVERGVNYPVLVGDQNVVRLMQSLGNAIGALPFTAVIGRDGEVLATHQGEWEAAEAERELADRLAAHASAGTAN
jgi:thiol-disulfide isomerase/thioredoxin